MAASADRNSVEGSAGSRGQLSSGRPSERTTFARIGRELQERAAAIQAVLAGAAAVDAEAAEQLAITRQQRFTGQSRMAAELARRHALASELSEAHLIYVFNSPEVYRILIVERGWIPKRYETWLATTLRRALLPASS